MPTGSNISYHEMKALHRKSHCLHITQKKRSLTIYEAIILTGIIFLVPLTDCGKLKYVEYQLSPDKGLPRKRWSMLNPWIQRPQSKLMSLTL